MNWTLQKDRSFSTEVSVLGYDGNTPSCPACNLVIRLAKPSEGSGQKPLNVLAAQSYTGGEITHWKGTCACGAKLTVFND